MRLVLGAWGPRHRSVNGPVGVERDGVHRVGGIGVLDEVLDQLDLVVLALGAEALERLRHRHVLARERLVGGDVLAHLRLDGREVRVGHRDPVGELEVVVEAVLDRRPDRDLHAGVELHHGGGQHVRGVVADEVERVLAAAIGDDLQRLVGLQRQREVAQLPVLLDGQRGARSPAPIAAAASAPLAPSGSSSGVPSGSVTFIAPDATRASPPPPCARVLGRGRRSRSLSAMDASALRDEFPVLADRAYLNAGTCGPLPTRRRAGEPGDARPGGVRGAREGLRRDADRAARPPARRLRGDAGGRHRRRRAHHVHERRRRARPRRPRARAGRRGGHGARRAPRPARAR